VEFASNRLRRCMPEWEIRVERIDDDEEEV